MNELQQQLAANNVANFEEIWSHVVMDEYKDQEVSVKYIEDIIRTCGWGFWLDQHTGGTYKERSTSGIVTEWCGFGAAFAMLQGGWIFDGDHGDYYALNPAIAKYVMPSTARLASKAKWDQANSNSRSVGFEPFKKVESYYDMQPGDIVVTGDRHAYGDHITMCAGLLKGSKWRSYEANAHGTLGNGEYGEGVVTRVRPLSAATHIYRPGLEHFVIVDV